MGKALSRGGALDVNVLSERIVFMAAKVDIEKCTGCGNCAEVCPVDAIKVNEKANIDAETCVDCGTCVDECPENAISMDE